MVGSDELTETLFSKAAVLRAADGSGFEIWSRSGLLSHFLGVRIALAYKCGHLIKLFLFAQ